MLARCLTLYLEITENPTASGINEYASRYRKLSIEEQGELAYLINKHYHVPKGSEIMYQKARELTKKAESFYNAADKEIAYAWADRFKQIADKMKREGK